MVSQGQCPERTKSVGKEGEKNPCNMGDIHQRSPPPTMESNRGTSKHGGQAQPKDARGTPLTYMEYMAESLATPRRQLGVGGPANAPHLTFEQWPIKRSKHHQIRLAEQGQLSIPSRRNPGQSSVLPSQSAELTSAQLPGSHLPPTRLRNSRNPQVGGIFVDPEPTTGGRF